MIAFLPERRQYIPLLCLIAALLNLRHFLAGQDVPASLSGFLTVCFVLASYGLLYSVLFWCASVLASRLPIGLAVGYALIALGRGPEGLDALAEGGGFPMLLAWGSVGFLLALAMTSRLMEPLERLRLPRNLLWPFALFCAAYAFLGLAVLRDTHWLVGLGTHLPALMVFAFFLFISDRLHVPAGLNWAGLIAATVLAVMGLGRHIPLEPPPMEAKGQNFLVITVEGLRHDAVTAAAMPNVSALARKGYLFTGMYGVSPSASRNLNGLFVRELDGKPVTLARLFPERFTRRALLPPGPVASDPAVLDGFSQVKIHGLRPFPSRMMRAWVPVALFVPPDRAPTEEEVAAECRLLLEGSSRPFIFWLHLDFPARSISGEAISRVRSGGVVPAADLWAGYERGLRRLDSALGGLFRWVEGRPWADKTNLLVLGVSGMELGEHGSAGNGHAFYDESVRFPFVWTGPPVSRGSAPTAMSIQDLYPTLVKTFNLADKPKAFVGMDISSAFRGVFPADRVFPLSGNEAYPPGRAVVAGGHKLIVSAGGRFELYDLTTDSRERIDLACADAARAEHMKGLLP